MENVRAHVLISGLVQGVFFRYTTRQEAQKLNVKGWVKNLWNGGVEAIFEGKKENVQRLIEWCHHGPAGASVKNVDVEWQEYLNEFDAFFIK